MKVDGDWPKKHKVFHMTCALISSQVWHQWHQTWLVSSASCNRSSMMSNMILWTYANTKKIFESFDEGEYFQYIMMYISICSSFIGFRRLSMYKSYGLLFFGPPKHFHWKRAAMIFSKIPFLCSKEAIKSYKMTLRWVNNGKFIIFWENYSFKSATVDI